MVAAVYDILIREHQTLLEGEVQSTTDRPASRP